MQDLFLSLLRFSVGTEVKLSRYPSEDEWGELYKMAVKQSLVGICFVGVRKFLEASAQSGEVAVVPKNVYFQWLGMAAQIQQRNGVMDQRCVELQSKLRLYGINSSILKGQAVAVYYGELKDFRQPGDIDVYVDCSRERTIEYARSIGQEHIDWDYKHLHLKIFKDVEVEMHYRPEVLLNLQKNKRLQRWFRSEENQRQIFQHEGKLVAPSSEFNLFYILLHIYRHFLYEGVGLRQLMDYYFVLKTASGEYRSKALQAIEKFGMERFAKGIMWIMLNVFGLDEQFLLCESDEKEGRYILAQVMAGGNFGHHDARLRTSKKLGKLGAVKKILKHNDHLLTHYPSEVVWAPVWIVYHWCWKRWVR